MSCEFIRRSDEVEIFHGIWGILTYQDNFFDMTFTCNIQRENSTLLKQSVIEFFPVIVFAGILNRMSLILSQNLCNYVSITLMAHHMNLELTVRSSIVITKFTLVRTYIWKVSKFTPYVNYSPSTTARVHL